MNLTTLTGIATCLLVAANPLLASEGEAPAPIPGESFFETGATDLSLQPDEDATGLGYETQHEELLRSEPAFAEGLGDFQWQPDGLALGAFHDEGPHDQGAAVPGPAGQHESLANAATNPVAPLIQLQLQNTFVGESNAGDGYSNAFVVQPVIPWKIADQNFLSRITVPLLVATPDLGDPFGRKYGIGDTVALNAWTFHIADGPFKGMIGPIFTFTLPTASSDFLGEGKYQVGPGGIYINTATKGIQWGIFGYQQWSVGSAGGDSDRREVSKLFFQPLLNIHFGEGWYTGIGDLLYTIDFNNNNMSFPLAWKLGKVTKFGNQNVNIFVEGFYDVSGNNPGNEWGAKINVTLLFPQ